MFLECFGCDAEVPWHLSKTPWRSLTYLVLILRFGQVLSVSRVISRLQDPLLVQVPDPTILLGDLYKKCNHSRSAKGVSAF